VYDRVSGIAACVGRVPFHNGVRSKSSEELKERRYANGVEFNGMSSKHDITSFKPREKSHPGCQGG